MKSSSTSGICLATATTESFVPGALVMLGSFLEHHPRFDGDLVIIHDALPQAARDALQALSDRVRFETVSTRLRDRLARLAAGHPAFASGREYFYSLEAFRLHGYRKVLFYDSDVLVRAPFDALFDAPGTLLCCPDHVALGGGRRDARTFEPLSPADPADAPALSNTFNSGFFLLDGRLADGACYADLLDMVHPHMWPGPRAPHTDQFLLNRCFAGRCTLVSSTYNYLLASAPAIRARENLAPEHAKVLHFNYPVKPWAPDAMLRWVWAHPARAPTRHFKLWSDARDEMAEAMPPAARTGSAARRPSSTRVSGAGRDLDNTVTTHLFAVCPNNSGSTFLEHALATCRAAWSLPREGKRMLGYAGPTTFRPPLPGEPKPGLIWSARRHWIDRFADPRSYDWPRNRKAWYFQASAQDPGAPVFVTKSPPFLLLVDQLLRHFRNAKFLFMVRNPYAICEGICRNYRSQFVAQERSLEEEAALHVVRCLAWQRRNVRTYGDCSVFFTYEAMCAEPEQVAQRIRALVPELDDLNLRRRLPVKDNTYDAMLTDMNARQIARLDTSQIAVFNRVFREHRDALDYFGYDLRGGEAGDGGQRLDPIRSRETARLSTSA